MSLVRGEPIVKTTSQLHFKMYLNYFNLPILVNKHTYPLGAAKILC